MFITVHAAAATIVGRFVPNAWLAFLLGLVSHFILDMIPHGDEEMEKRFCGLKFRRFREEEQIKFMAWYGSMDSFFLAVYLIFLFKNFDFAHADNVVWAIIGGILPDIMAVLYKVKKIKTFEPINWFHTNVHRSIINRFKINIKLKPGIFMQVCIMIFLVWMIYFI